MLQLQQQGWGGMGCALTGHWVPAGLWRRCLGKLRLSSCGTAEPKSHRAPACTPWAGAARLQDQCCDCGPKWDRALPCMQAAREQPSSAAGCHSWSLPMPQHSHTLEAVREPPLHTFLFLSSCFLLREQVLHLSPFGGSGAFCSCLEHPWVL